MKIKVINEFRPQYVMIYTIKILCNVQTSAVASVSCFLHDLGTTVKSLVKFNLN
jgi:hypothetical protein